MGITHTVMNPGWITAHQHTHESPSVHERDVKHENYPRKIPYISKKVSVWKIAYMKFTYTKFPTENILHIFWVWKIPYKKISYNNLEAYFCNWWTISPWKLTDVIWNWN